MSAKKKKPSLRDLSRHELEDWDAYVKEAIGESDRACALVVSALLDQVLIEAIRLKLMPSDDDDQLLFFVEGAPFGSLHNRTLMASVLELINPSERKDLDIVRRVRNAFAHSAVWVTFSHELIAAECAKLENFDPATVASEPEMDVSRVKFVDTAHTLYQRLMEKVFQHAEAFIDDMHRDLDDLNGALDELRTSPPGSEG